MLRGVMQSRGSYVALVSGPDGKTYHGACERSSARRHHPKRDATGHRHHAGSQRSPLAGEAARSAKGTQDSGRWQITSIDSRTPNGRRAAAAPGRIVGGGLDAARRVRPACSGATPSAAAPQLKGLSASAGRRITTVTIETSDPVAYLTSRPDPMTLLVDLRDVDATRCAQRAARAPRASWRARRRRSDRRRWRTRRARPHSTDAAGRSSGAQQAQRHLRRFRQCVPARHPLATRRRRPPAAPASSRFATMLENVRAEAKPTGASHHADWQRRARRRVGDAVRRRHAARRARVSERRSQAPADVFVGRGPVSVVHVTRRESCRRRASSSICSGPRPIA